VAYCTYLVMVILRKKINFSKSEIDLLRYFVGQEVENIQVFGPADDAYQRRINSLMRKLA